MRDRYIVELAQTANVLFGAGRQDPSAEEIAEAHFPGKALGNEIIDGVRKRLKKVRDVLEEDFQHPVYLVNETYYARYRGAPPTTEAEARRCIPGGYLLKSAGIRINNGGDDLIYRAMLGQNVLSGASKVRKTANRALQAVRQKRLALPAAAALLDRAKASAQPDDLALAGKVLGALPGRKPR